MKTYVELYNDGLSYFQYYFEKVTDDLSHMRCITVCAAYKLGDRRFLEYLAYKLKETNQYTVYLDDRNSFNTDTLNKIQQDITTTQKVLIIPYFEEKDKTFKELFNKIMRNRSNTFLSVIKVNANFLEAPEQYFPDTNIPMESICIMTPFSKAESEAIIKAREKLDNIVVGKKARTIIINQAGGHAGLIKRLCSVYRQKGTFEINFLLSDPPIKTELLQLEHQMRTLSTITLQRLGLLSTTERCTIPLLDRFIENTQNKVAETMTSTQKTLFQFLKKHRQQPATLEQIHKLLFPNTPYSMWATYKFVSRFAKVISPTYHLKNTKGKGYQLFER